MKTVGELTDDWVQVAMAVTVLDADRARLLGSVSQLLALTRDLERVTERYKRKHRVEAWSAGAKLETAKASLHWLQEYGEIVPVAEVSERILIVNRCAMVALGLLRLLQEAGTGR